MQDTTDQPPVAKRRVTVSLNAGLATAAFIAGLAVGVLTSTALELSFRTLVEVTP